MDKFQIITVLNRLFPRTRSGYTVPTVVNTAKENYGKFACQLPQMNMAIGGREE